MKTSGENDEIREEILNIMKTSDEPLETEEIVSRIRSKYGEATRTKVMYRLNNLRGEGKIQGKMLGAGKGVWIWWTSKLTMTASS